MRLPRANRSWTPYLIGGVIVLLLLSIDNILVAVFGIPLVLYILFPGLRRLIPASLKNMVRWVITILVILTLGGILLTIFK